MGEMKNTYKILFMKTRRENTTGNGKIILELILRIQGRK
jgi:hypothetical protein